MLTHLQIVHAPVTDQAAAREFYAGTLGFEVLADVEMGPHGRWLQVAPPGAATSLALVPPTEGAPTTAATLVIESTDIDKDVAVLAERGVAFDAGIEDMPWGRAASFADPDGNVLVLQTPTAEA